MAAFFLKKKKEVTETVEEPQKTVEAAKKEAETVNTEPPATIVCPASVSYTHLRAHET